MEINKNDTELFLDLETRLHKKEFRNSTEKVAELLADDFIEFGSSGLVYDKAFTLKSLAKEAVDLEIEVMNFKVKYLAADIRLITYATSKLDIESNTKFESLRSSIWKNTKGKWQMLFHQGTKKKS